MIRLGRQGILSAALVMATTAASAQVYRYPDQRRDRGGYGRSGYGDAAAVAQRAARNLEFAARNSYVDGHEREHFAKAISELERFQDRWVRQGRFDSGRLDRAIDNMRHLAEARQVDRRTRRVIAQDIEMLRDLRARGDRDRYRYRD
ncbi:MAG: hypothetical protein ACRD88_09220 [Terriglobia bacterium]